MQRLPTLPVECVDQIDQSGVLQAVVAEQPSDMGPVLLLNMPNVVLLVRTRAGEPHRLGAILEMVSAGGQSQPL